MQKNLRIGGRAFRLLLGGSLVWASIYVFTFPLTRIVVAIFGSVALVEAVVSFCVLLGRCDVKRVGDFANERKIFLMALLGIQSVIAYEWLTAGLEKIENPEFVTGMEKTLGFFASNNTYLWYKNFLHGFATSHASFFAYAVMWGEVLVGVTLLLGSGWYLYTTNNSIKRWLSTLFVVALVAGAFMSAHFYLAAGWTSPSTSGVNGVMFWIQGVLMYVWSVLYTQSATNSMGNVFKN